MKKLADIKKTLKDKTPKQMRTLRNQLNNRIKSYDDEVKFGKSLPKLSESHSLFGLTVGECKELLVSAKSEIRLEKKSHDQDND